MKATDLKSLDSYVKALKEELKVAKPCTFVLVKHKFKDSTHKIILMGQSLSALKNEFDKVIEDWDPLDQGRYEKPKFIVQKAVFKLNHLTALKIPTSDLLIDKEGGGESKSRFGAVSVAVKQLSDIGETNVEDVDRRVKEVELFLSKINRTTISDRSMKAAQNLDAIIVKLKECIEKKDTKGAVKLMEGLRQGMDTMNQESMKIPGLKKDLDLLEREIKGVTLESYKIKINALYDEAKNSYANARHNEAIGMVEKIETFLRELPNVLVAYNTVVKIESKLKMQLRIPNNNKIEAIKDVIKYFGVVREAVDQCKTENAIAYFGRATIILEKNGFSIATGDMVGELSSAMGESIIDEKGSLQKAYQNQKKLFTVEVTNCLKKSIESKKPEAAKFFKQLAEFIKDAKGDLGSSLKGIDDSTERNPKFKLEVQSCLETVAQRIESMKQIMENINPEAKEMELPQTRKYLHVLGHVKTTLVKLQ